MQKLRSNETTLDEASSALGVEPQVLKARLTRWGNRLPRLIRTLDSIREDKITRDEAAAKLGVSVRQVNNLMISWEVKRPLKDYLVTREASKVKWEIRKKCAIDYISGVTSLIDASEEAEVSDRQMRRWVSDLLKKHYEMTYKELNGLSLTKRKRLAEEVETAEGLELEKQQALRDVTTGVKSIRETALARVMFRRSGRDRRVRDRDQA